MLHEESSRDLPLSKNPQKAAESEDTNTMAQDQAPIASFASYDAVGGGGGGLALPENVPQILDSNNFPTRNSENAVYDDTKIPVVVKRARKYKHKQSSSSLLGAAEEKNGGVRIDENLEKSHMARERKKSKYLSYPYIDPMDETNAGSNETKQVSNLKSEIDKGKIINLTSEAMLWKLCLTAQSGSNKMERKHSGPVKSFFSSFRRFTFLKLEDDSSRDLYESEQATSSADGSKLTGYVAASGNLEENSLKMGNPCTTNNPEFSGISGNHINFVQLLNDVQASVPNMFRSIVQENKAGSQSSFISNSRQSEAEENQVESASSGKNCSPEAQCVPPGFVPQPEKVGQKLKKEVLNISNNKVAVSGPDGNVIVDESNSIRNCKQIASPDSVPARKRRERKKKEEALNIPNDETGISSQNMNDTESPLPKEKPIKRRKKKNSLDAVPDSNLQNKSAAILLNFTSGFSLPSIESIFQAFSCYGIINKSETRYVNDSAAQVVFVRSVNAKEAFKSLQTNNPFGPVLGNYQFQPLSAPATENKLQTQESLPAMNGIIAMSAPPPGINSKDGESPNIEFLKQKLEMMTSMLEKAGSNLTPEMRAKLESEIGSFAEKVNSMVGSSSS